MGKIFSLTLLFYLFQESFSLYNDPLTISGAETFSKTKSVSWQEIIRVGRYAAALYCGKSGYDQTDCQKWNTTLTTYTAIMNSEINVKAIVGVLKGGTEAVVAFRETDGPKNLLLDLTPIPIETDGDGGKFKFHMGLYTASMSIYDEIARQLQRFIIDYPGINRILLTGVSLGGAMASITVFKLNYSGTFRKDMNYTLVTFGQPRTGNREYAEYMNNLGIPIARVVARGDIVPHVPPTVVLDLPPLGTTFLHHHQEIWVEDEEMKKVTYCSMKVFEDPKCSNSLKMKYSIPEHFSCKKYFEIMNNKSWTQ